MMKNFLILFSFLGFLMNSQPAQAVNFIEGLEDVPLMEGLKQISKDNLSFGNEESRLVEVYLSAAKTNFAKVADFYQQTLPQLGWNFQGKRENTLIFYREGEALDIVQESAKPLVVRLTVKNKI